MTDVDTGPVPLRLPAILQNPTNYARRQVDAYNVQQREKAAARREANRREDPVPNGSKRGKRVVRRMNNASFIDNPHITAPRRSDLSPSVPLHTRPLRPAFPGDAIERIAPIPGAEARADPAHAAPSSQAGAFTTSLKGTRALLRRRGRRAELLVPKVENAVRAWLGGDYDPTQAEWAWRVIDNSPVAVDAASKTSNGTNGVSSGSPPNQHAGPSRRMPPQHQVREAIPALPRGDEVAAVLELTRSAANLSWAVPDSFDRLVVHLVARYYELVSWSEDHTTVAGERVRLTHLVRPTVARARAPPSHALLTPETSDVSGASGTESGTEHGTTYTSESDTATEMGDYTDYADSANGDADGDTTLQAIPPSDLANGEDAASAPSQNSLTAQLAALELQSLHRTASHGSSAYASSEGGFSEAGLEASSMSFGAPSTTTSPLATTSRLPPLSPVAATFSLPHTGPKRTAMPQRFDGGDWSDKPSFFEYLFGE